MSTRILVIEDDEAIRNLVVDVLSNEGYAVAHAANGFAALREVARQAPDAIVLDLMMPGMDGRAFLRAYATEFPNRPVPIVLVSASPTLWQTAEQLRRYGVRGFVAKPFDLNVLIAAVSRVVAPAPLPAHSGRGSYRTLRSQVVQFSV